MTFSSTPQGHLVLFPYVGWGHSRAPCNLVARLVRTRPIYVTYFTTIELCERVQNEIRRSFESEDPHLASLIRVVAVSDAGRVPSTLSPAEAVFADVYKTLIDQQPLTCCHTGVQYPAIQSPSVAIIDLAMDGPLKVIRKFSGRLVKILGWAACSASLVVALTSTQLNIPPRGVLEEALRTGKDRGEVAQEMIDNLGGAVLNIPGLPILYDHEIQPQKLYEPIKCVVGPAIMQFVETLTGCDGIVILSVECLETTCLDNLRSEYSGASRTLHVCGPLVPISAHATVCEVEAASSAAVMEFMDRMLETYGKKSLVYVSFGSWLWPADPEVLWAFLDVLIELKIPFVFGHASFAAVVPDAVLEKVRTSELGFISPWAPQQAILAHSVTGWMVTHAGQNSFIEAMTYGIPLICWPFAYDQPYIALHASTTLDVAYELFEVRSGPGRGLVHRLGRAPAGTLDAVRCEAREVLGRAFGEDGQRKRENALRLREEMARAWDAGGPSTRDLNALVELVAGRDAVSACAVSSPGPSAWCTSTSL